MKTTTILKRLEKLASEKRVNKTTSAYKLIVAACNEGNAIIRPCWTSGSGRFCSNMDYTKDTCHLLDLLRVRYERGNDAPRGGLPGNFIKIKHFNE